MADIMASLRFSSLLLVAAVGLQALGCSSDPASSFESASLEALDEESDPMEESSGPGKTQTPPVKLMITGLEATLIKMVATQTAIGGFAAQTEHWNTQNDLVIRGDLELESVPLDSTDTETALKDWLSPLDSAFTTPRIVSQSDWQRGTADIPEGLDQYLFWTQHPDDANDVLGVLLVVKTGTSELDGSVGKLVAAAWYRTSAATTDGAAFRSRLFRSPLKLVVDADGRPSTDPDLIQEADWHHVVMPMR